MPMIWVQVWWQIPFPQQKNVKATNISSFKANSTIQHIYKYIFDEENFIKKMPTYYSNLGIALEIRSQQSWIWLYRANSCIPINIVFFLNYYFLQYADLSGVTHPNTTMTWAFLTTEFWWYLILWHHVWPYEKWKHQMYYNSYPSKMLAKWSRGYLLLISKNK